MLNICVRIKCDDEWIYDSEESLHRNVLLFYGGAEISANQVKRDHYTLVVPKMSEVKTENTDIIEIDSMKNAGLKAFFLELKDGYVLSVDGRLIAFDSENGTDLKVITPSESTSLPTVTIQDTEAFLAFRKSTCSIILGNRDYTQQFVLLKDGERIEFDSLEQSDNGLAFTMPFDGEHDTVRIQVINLANERLMFDRTFVLISEADCCFNREFYYNANDYDGAEFYADIDDFHEVVPFGKDEAEVRIPFRDGELHADIPKITVSETSGAWLQEPQPAWYIGHIPQNSFLKVTTPARVNVQFLVGGKDILYDGQGLVTIGNVLQSFGGTDSFNDAEVVMRVAGQTQSASYSLARVFFKERFLKRPSLWTEEQKLLWDQGGVFIGTSGREFTLLLSSADDKLFEFKLSEDTEYIILPEDMPIGNYQFEISIQTGGLFKRAKEVVAVGDCIIGDKNLLRFMNRRIVVESITDEFKEEAGHILITRALRATHNVTQQDVVNIIGVAAQASKNKSALIKARYHMFAKALEGAYVTLGQNKKLMLNRNRSITIGDENWKVFECAICDDCGRVAVAGKEVDGKLEFANSSYDPEIEYYLLRDSRDIDLDLDEEDEDDTEEIGKNDYILCSKCGALIHESLKADPPCTCGLTHYVKLRKARKSGSRGDGKCPSCNFGTFKTFYLGYDAATAVLGTSLFEELPESEKVLKSKKSAQPVKKSLFGAAKQGAQVDIVRRKRQFLSFSDSRGEAAFFASYMTAAYSEFLRRRGIWHVVEKNKENMAAHPWEIQHFVDELTSYFDSCRTFAEPGDKGVENLTATSRKNAWIAVLNEMVNARRSTSLASLGILKFNYKGNAEEIMSGVAEAYQQKVEDVKALFDLLAMEIVYHGALEGDCDLTDDEREYIFYTPKPKRVKRCKDMDKDKKKSYLAGWSAAIRKNGSLLKNGRLKRVMSVLNLDEASANELLQMYWDEVLRGEESLSTAGNDEFYFSTERFTVSSGTEDIPIYVCDVCGKTTTMNCKDMCTTLKCGGHLRRITHDSLLKDNHYAKLYQSSLMQPLHIKEHTAQLGREEQQKYQEMFVNKEINALSCSTTFEMGVDVGDLETVYLRNMPPSPANYVQRAGRAGRGKNAAAFSLTYAKLSSHDFTYFKNPENMITGKIGVPLFTVRNEKIILRHIFAVALSDFFAKQVDVYNSNNADVLLSGDGWERFCAYLSSKPEHLKDVLKASIPESMHRVMGINDFSWTEKLVGKDGVLKVAVDEFRGTVQYYIDEYRRLLAEGLTQQAAAVEKKLWSYRRGKEDNRGRNELIEFLVRNNVLPKYGFPVDTVELYQNTNAATDKKLQMVRDLQLAISEYAPDSQVVADGKLYTSRYIRKLPQTTGQDWETAYIAQCNNPSCMTWNHRLMEPDEGGEPCVSCHEIISKSRWKQAIEPRKGFVADAKPKDVPMRKPDKAFRSDDFYIGDAQRQVMQKYAFVMKDGNRFQMETSINDSLMVVCNDDFYVCPHCGYAESTMENMEVAGFNSHQKTLEKKHITPWGKNCEVKLVKNKLCHVFKTDVVRLVFSTPQAGNQEVMLSVMYALLEALSSVMDIERNDIKGCLHKIVYDNKLIYAIVLYDAVAGGAGHVRRLVTEDGRCFRQVVEKAIAITKGCNCSPSCYSCLRNYYNQKIHDLLNRKYAYDFLENYYGELEPITNEEFENGELYNV